jgi:hypothetical protein
MDNPNVPPRWSAPEGTEHRFCPGCRHWFASRGTSRCPTCVSGQGRGKSHKASLSPFDAGGSSGRQLSPRLG